MRYEIRNRVGALEGVGVAVEIDGLRAIIEDLLTRPVWVARSADPFGDAEVYVFDTEESAQAFAKTRGDDYLVTEEPVLDAEFARESESA